MKKLRRFTFISFYLLCLSLIYLSTVDKYTVIYSLDPDITLGSLSHNGDNGKVFVGLILLILIVSQAIFLCFEKTRGWKLATVVMTALAFFFTFIN